MITHEKRRSSVHLLKMTHNYTSGEPVLHDCDIMVVPGGIVLVEGANGSGKTTLMRYIGGLLSSSTKNQTVNSFLRANPRRFYYFPDDVLFPNLTVQEFLFLSRPDVSRGYGREFRSFCSQIDKVMSEFSLVANRNTLIRELSTGNRAILRFLNLSMSDYDILLLDEPSAHLDEHKVGILLSILRKFLPRQNCYCLLSSHDPRLINALSGAPIAFRFRMEAGHVTRIW